MEQFNFNQTPSVVKGAVLGFAALVAAVTFLLLVAEGMQSAVKFIEGAAHQGLVIGVLMMLLAKILSEKSG